MEGHSMASTNSAARLLNFFCAVYLLGAVSAAADVCAQTVGEARFFKDCPHHRRISLHRENNPWDAHAVFYSSLGLTEVEVLSLLDWIIDVPIPGPPLRPLEEAARGIRKGYNRLPPVYPVHRFGQLVDAFQLPELSIGDATAAHSLANGGVTGPGSGMIVRVNKLIDWTQLMTGDLNSALGGLVRRPEGLIGWQAPAQNVDRFQWALCWLFNQVSVIATKTLDGGVHAVEMAGEGIANFDYQTPHSENTVFLELPPNVFLSYELWILEHQDDMVIDVRDVFLRQTHASLAHQRHNTWRKTWGGISQLERMNVPVVIMAPQQVIARSPAALKDYIVPASWILDPELKRPGSAETAPIDAKVNKSLEDS